MGLVYTEPVVAVVESKTIPYTKEVYPIMVSAWKKPVSLMDRIREVKETLSEYKRKLVKSWADIVKGM